MMKGNYKDYDYKIDSRTYSLMASYRYYFTEFANFYLEPMVALSYWQGTTGAGVLMRIMQLRKICLQINSILLVLS